MSHVAIENSYHYRELAHPANFVPPKKHLFMLNNSKYTRVGPGKSNEIRNLMLKSHVYCTNFDSYNAGRCIKYIYNV